MILELDWMNVSSASNDIRRNGGNIVGVGSHARQISQEPPSKLAGTLFYKKYRSPDRRQVERPPPSLQITSIFLVFYGLSHGTTLKKKGVAVF